MRIAIVTPRTHHETRERGALRVRDIIAGLVRGGHRVDVLTPRWWDQRSRSQHDRWSTHRAVGTHRPSAVAVWRTLRRLDPDIVHLVNVRPSIVLAASSATSAPIVYEATGLATPLAAGQLSGFVRGRIHDIIVPAEVVTTLLMEAGIEGPMQILADPIEFDCISRVVPNRRGDIVWAAPSLENANLEDLLLGLAELRDRQWSAVLFLGTDERTTALNEADELGLRDRLDVVTDSTRRERLAVYRGASAFVQTAANCAFPTELLWAMAAGCVGVVQYQHRSSAHELVQSHGHGRRVSSPEELGDAIVEAAQMEASTLEPDFKAYDVTAVVDRLLEVYSGAISHSE